jgi:hypothetical protein
VCQEEWKRKHLTQGRRFIESVSDALLDSYFLSKSGYKPKAFPFYKCWSISGRSCLAWSYIEF